MTIVYIGDIW